MDKFEEFVYKTQPKGILYITGIVSALRQELFIPYTKRSADLFRNTLFSHLHCREIHSYRKFNDLYRRISKETDMILLELDDIQNNEWYLENSE